MSGAAESGNLVAELVGDDVDPTQQITPDDLKSLSTTKVIVDQNYIDLNGLADGDLYTQETDGHTNVAEPTYSCHPEQAEVYLLNVKAAMQNFISALYSFHECIEERLDQYLPSERELTSDDLTGNVPSSEYAYRAGFLIGLRTDAQHYGFDVTEELDWYRT